MKYESVIIRKEWIHFVGSNGSPGRGTQIRSERDERSSCVTVMKSFHQVDDDDDMMAEGQGGEGTNGKDFPREDERGNGSSSSLNYVSLTSGSLFPESHPQSQCHGEVGGRRRQVPL